MTNFHDRKFTENVLMMLLKYMDKSIDFTLGCGVVNSKITSFFGV